MKRFQKEAIIADLEKKMVLLAGPRQAGKTTLAKEIGREFGSVAYLNFDSRGDREVIEQEAWLPTTELLIFDEIHKMSNWKTFLKGVYDTKSPHQKILVTGSARLEVFNQVGDSLAGRYFLHRLMPLSPAELEKVGEKSDLDRFLDRGGFPEPYLSDDPIDAKRWRLQYVDSLLRTDVLDFDNIHNLRAIRLVFDLLRSRAGSPISYSSIAEDVAVSPNTVKKYISILEALYVVFRVVPYSRNIARSLLKEPKIYFFDTGLVQGDSGAKFENFVAGCLYKHVLAKIDYEAEEYSLHYMRTKDQHEVDFALVRGGELQQLIEVKHASHQLGAGLLYFHEKYNVPSVQVVKELRRERVKEGVQVVDGSKFLMGLAL